MSLALAALLAGCLAADARQRSGGPPMLEAPKGTAAISGVVIDATTGRPVEGAMVSLGVTTGGPIILTLPRVMTDPKGRFLFRDLAPSTKYYIRAARVGYAPARFGAAAPGIPSDRLSDMEIRTTDDIVTVSVAAEQWVSDLQVRLDRLIEVRPGSPSMNVVLAMSERHTELSGTLRTPGGQPGVDVFVIAFSTDRAMWGPGARRVRAVRPGSDGRFSMPDLPPGDYLLGVVTDIEPEDWQDPALLEQLAPTSVKVELGEGEKKVQDLQLGVGGTTWLPPTPAQPLSSGRARRDRRSGL